MYVCKTCNQTVNESAKYCPNCGSPQNAVMHGIRDYSAKRRPVGVFGKIMLVLLGLCAVFLLVQSVLLSAFGVNTTAVIYNAEQQNYRFTDDRYDPTRFELSYRYTVSGETYEGKSTMYFEYGYVTEMGADGKEIPKTAVVRYFPPIPGWSNIVSVPGGKHDSHLMKNPFGWLGLGLLVLLIAVMVIRGRRLRKRRKSGEGTL